ncbi:NADP-dependent oxidoreductase [Sphingobium fuliginis]|uniref:NADP-dependent oxidoreductase n=1 Tax=Sphingobium fuliginis (strain ATCC 27551) TaxID=336203 RepID=A0A7M2GKW0_SPHSA|nr:MULTISPECIES: NADP-dependent oxidoreductase [Sphingobium]AJR23264.1 alcohol dehydrogenase [Sphingobium sp. YBL2]QOT73371.1 NADP-dependent oxidoreductase [Sphingobium fuliginis]UXC93647.1 NADP-dependent oxidoreductase [Sphingobium sp. RSMS]
MKAIVINRHGGPEVLEPADLPPPQPKQGETLVRILAAAVNPADGKWRAGLFESFAPVGFPHVLGYDVAGEVIGGEGFAPGARVFGMLDPFRKGGYAEQVAVAADHLAPVPDGLDLPTAAAIPTAGLTGLQMVERGLDLQAGQRLMLTGALGAVGRFALFAAKERGVHVTAAVRAAHVEAVRALGADDVIALGKEDWSGASFDHVIDTVGGEAVGALCRHLKPGGRVLTAATTPIPSDELPSAPEFFAVVPSGPDAVRLGAAVAQGRIAVPIARILPLDQAAEAQRLVDAGGLNGKVILTN